MFRPALAAAIVVAGRADVVVVGSTALVLHGYQLTVRDLDLVPAPDPVSLTQLRKALVPVASASAALDLRLRFKETVTHG